MKNRKNRSAGKPTKVGDANLAHNRTLAFSDNVKKRRSCLMCGKMFKSDGPFNRRCSKCNRTVELGKGGGISMPHVYKVSYKDTDALVKLSDITGLKE